MDNKEFNKVLHEILINYGFLFKNKNYYKNTNDLIVVVNTQKSNYDDSIYINYAIFVKDIHIGSDYPKVQEGDIRGRFLYDDGNVSGNYDLIKLNKTELQNNLKMNIDNIFTPLFDDGLKRYFELYPKALYTATKRMKEYLINNSL